MNGVSSSGKSSLAKQLQKLLDVPYLHVCIDTFEEMMPERRGEGGEFAFQMVFNKMLSGFHHSIAALAECGNNLIVDHVLVEGEDPLTWVPECMSLLVPFDVFLVGVHCSLPELERRERERGDRPAGLANWQYTRMHLKVKYDVEVDTTEHTTEECVIQVLAALSLSTRHGFVATMAGLDRHTAA